MATNRFALFLFGLLSCLVGLLSCVVSAFAPKTEGAVGERASFAAAIDVYLAQHPDRICTLPFNLPYDERLGGLDEVASRAARREELRWLDGLANAGLLVKARTTARGTGASGPTPIEEYQLSREGRNDVEDARAIELGAPARFCVGETHVAAIVGAAISQRGGARVATVRYRPGLANRAAWTKRARTKRAMPWLAAWMNEQLPERRVTLRSLADGWIEL